jgi:hypothetical protein
MRQCKNARAVSFSGLCETALKRVSVALIQFGVIAGLDPAIHLLAKKMDPRVKPAGDDGNESIRPKHALVLVPAPPTKFEFSFLKANLMVRSAWRIIFSP